MPTEVYKLVHMLGLALAVLALGGLSLRAVAGVPGDDAGARKLAAITHGIGMACLLVGGFGLLARMGGGFPPWVIAKLAVWFLLGAAMMPLRRGMAIGRHVWWAVPALVLAAASLAVYKPGV